MVTVQFRVGDVLLPASGTFAADTGRSIYHEQHVEHLVKRSYFRWEIPYQYIHRIEEAEETQEPPAAPKVAPSEPEVSHASAASAGPGLYSSSAASLLALPQRPKTV